MYFLSGQTSCAGGDKEIYYRISSFIETGHMEPPELSEIEMNRVKEFIPKALTALEIEMVLLIRNLNWMPMAM